MVEVSLYHLTQTPLEKALPKLMEKVYQSGKRAVIKLTTPERLDALNKGMWTFSSGAFLPHGSASEGNPDYQPIWLTCDEDNPNQATFLVLADGAAQKDLSSFERCIDMFEASSSDTESLQQARERYQTYLSQGHQVVCWIQDTTGKWAKAERI